MCIHADNPLARAVIVLLEVTPPSRPTVFPPVFGHPYGQDVPNPATEFVGVSTPDASASAAQGPYPGHIVSAAPTAERNAAALAAEYVPPATFSDGTPAFVFGRHTATGVLYVRAYGVWSFVRDEGVYGPDGEVLDIKAEETQAWRDFAFPG